MPADDLSDQMRLAATALLKAMDGPQRLLAERPFTDDTARRWLEYRPRQRPGACIADFTVTARKAAHRLLATALSEHAYAQAMAIISPGRGRSRPAPGITTGCRATTCSSSTTTRATTATTRTPCCAARAATSATTCSPATTARYGTDWAVPLEARPSRVAVRARQTGAGTATG